MLATGATIKKLEQENKSLADQLKSCQQENMELESCQQQLQTSAFDPETVKSSIIKDKLFAYYTGLTCVMFLALFDFLVSDVKKNPICYSGLRLEIDKFSLK